MVLKIHEASQNLIDKYLNLPLGDKSVPCPYYINTRNLKMGLRVLIGKGTPDEIVQESLIYEKLRGANFNDMSVEKIRDFLVKRHIGVDCSGFVLHVLDTWLRSKHKKHIWKYLHFPHQGFYRFVARKLRPVENIGAYMLTNDENSSEISNLNNILPGDLIRSKGLKGGYHVMVITEVNINDGKVSSFKFYQSTRWYGNNHGVRSGIVKIKDSSLDLTKQDWIDDEGDFSYRGILVDRQYSQVRRLVNVPLN